MIRAIQTTQSKVNIYYFGGDKVEIPTSVGQWHVDSYSIVDTEKISLFTYFEEKLKSLFI